MSAFTVHSTSSAPAASRPLLEQAERNYGFLPNLLGVLASSPAALTGYMQLGEQFAQSSFTPAEQQVVLLAVSALNGCDYCVAAHSKIADMQQVPGDVVEALRTGQPLGDAKLQALREFALLVVENRGWVDQEAKERFFEAGYSEKNVLEVLLGVALKTLSNYSNHFAQTPLDAAFQPRAWSRPEAVPSPS